MFNRRHRRHSAFPTAIEPRRSGALRKIILLLAAAALLYYLGAWTLNALGLGGSVRREAVTLTPEGRGTVNVVLEDGGEKPASTELKIYPGETAATKELATATLSFFDGSFIRLDQNSEVEVEESGVGEEVSEISLIANGTLYVKTPSKTDFTNAITRTIEMQGMTIIIPSDAEFTVSSDTIAVFSADGLGISLELEDVQDPLSIGEGQSFAIPDAASRTGDLYRFRKAITAQQMRDEFYTASRALALAKTGVASGTGVVAMEPTDSLTVTNPKDDQVVTTPTISVEGRVGDEVVFVRANGYSIAIDEENGTFKQELALSNDDEIEIRVEARDKDNNVVGEVIRTVRREVQAPDTPHITSPAAEGSVYASATNELEIRGTVAAGTVGVLVNDYRLQLFQEGSTTWSYLASERLGNMKQGDNVYTVVALNAAGERSAPVSITIRVGSDQQGVISSGTSASSAAAINPSTLPNNDPLTPGMISITGPTAGQTHTETTNDDLLIEGNVSKDTASVWVNDYQLQLYTPGKGFFNYIANVELGTLKEGNNTYKIVARDKDGKILDTLTYTITYTLDAE